MSEWHWTSARIDDGAALTLASVTVNGRVFEPRDQHQRELAEKDAEQDREIAGLHEANEEVSGAVRSLRHQRDEARRDRDECNRQNEALRGMLEQLGWIVVRVESTYVLFYNVSEDRHWRVTVFGPMNIVATARPEFPDVRDTHAAPAPGDGHVHVRKP